MNLKTLVILVSLFQALVDCIGIIVSVIFPDILLDDSTIQPQNYTRQLSNQTTDILSQDFSYVRTVNILYYIVPYLFSGVIPRMLNGLECLTADQLVGKYLSEHQQAQEYMVEGIPGFPPNRTYWLDVLNSTRSKLKGALGRRKIQCCQFEVPVANHKRKNFQFEIVPEDAISHFKNRDHEVKNRFSANLMSLFELITMGLNAGASLLLVIIANLNQKLPLLHSPWLLLSAIEITGNVLVAMVFSVELGYCQITSLVCIVKTVWLSTIWSKVVRKSMARTINPGVVALSQDTERRMLRTQLSNKGRPRLYRLFGSYS